MKVAIPGFFDATVVDTVILRPRIPVAPDVLVFRVIPATEEVIEEDSFFRKVLCCIPVIGNQQTSSNERSLTTKITNTKEVSRAIKLLELKNQYKECAMVRTAIVVTLFSLIPEGILPGSTYALVTVSLSLSFLQNMLNLSANKVTVKDLRERGMSRDGVTSC